MQDLDNDMDDLFLRAADNYTVKAGNSNWDEIAPRLTSAKTSAAAVTKNNRKTKYAVATVLFLIFILSDVIITKHTGLNKPIVVHNSSQQNNTHNTFKNFAEKESMHTAVFNKKLNKSSLLFADNGVFKNQSLLPALNNLQRNISGDDVIKNNLSINQTKKNINNKESENEISKQQLKDTSTAETSTVKTVKSLNKHGGFYLGVISGIQFNEVKSQSFQKPGLDVGIQAGYAFNSKVSLESGLLLSKKYYTSSGKYFNMSKMPASMQVLSLEGCSDVVQIPIKIKYNVLYKNENAGFIAAGITSYLLTKEKNNYHAVINGTKQDITNVYKNSSGYAAATMDISAGYERTFKNNTQLTIEPFVQIPLKGIGVGGMPVTTAGVHFGLSFFPHH